MKPIYKYYLTLLLALAAYATASKFIFDKVYDTTQTVIDELFHIPQGVAYCERNFTHWDSKITTLPGLYLVSAAVLGSYLPCDTYHLRLVNLVASCVNLLLFSSILKFVYGSNTESQFKIVLQAFNLAILPPLYFFSHVYYTDTLSLTFLLAFSRLCFTSRHKFFILVFGLCSVLMRQTNIVFIAMVLGHKVLDIMIKSSRVFGNKYLTRTLLNKNSVIARDVDASKLKRYYSMSDVFLALGYHITTCFGTFFKFLTKQDWLIILTHSVTLISFVSFVYKNGSIVVGDKTAHQASLHLPQMLYFLIFYGIFGLPYLLAKLPSTLKLMARNKTNIVLYGILFTIIVHFNTVTHPYLLADNRHYTFYVWNRWFGKYAFAKYATVPAYIFLLFSLYDNLKDQNCISFLLPYTISLFLVVALQKMIEIRYFLIPYIVLRLRFVRPTYKIVVFEFVWYLIINAVTFNLFFNKEIMWKNFDYAQRIIW
ncbi:putative Dol-P-Glc:Glc(2)Man(9)GlcNAc(2)-PP-Dol alpha-1,2-glucosyltransferase [Leguminivora glycinivorella]|uniref:putative Dol-P-Glc:Glc(2)Man(9)GlcNAc(2)-PP-Dol alpha-1,2-glucosyltransferase n=1 Tax=Leguminivora glycinivorella TaxID=1035111 RepID=UPI00200DBBC6|nr:putative Dol-P-Glc:Glc(2)Man(9)GlcNAc(2)-PP-Dol alpha-1,2-glucosyltransferase [Leguminivora glycinivorella]